MKRYIDLTGKLENGLWSYRVLPGLEGIILPVSIQTIANVRENGFFASKISFCTISGTYVESGSHILENGKMLDEYEVGDFIKSAHIIHLPAQKPGTLINEKLLKKYAPDGNFKGEALLIDTGWGKNWNREGYVLNCPNFTRKAIEWVISRGISMFCVDVPCIEGAWSEDVAEEKGGLLSILFEKDILLVAPLVNLENVKGNRGVVYALPLYVAETSGAPARVVFEEEV
jgi:kynurenine formamidase